MFRFLEHPPDKKRFARFLRDTWAFRQSKPRVDSSRRAEALPLSTLRRWLEDFADQIETTRKADPEHPLTDAQISQLLYNADETHAEVFKLVSTCYTTSGEQGRLITGGTKHAHVSAICGCRADGVKLPPVLCVPLGQSESGLPPTWETRIPETEEVGDFAIVRSGNGWTREAQFIDFIQVMHEFSVSQGVTPTSRHPLMLVMDNCSSHKTATVMAKMEELNIVPVFLPANTSHVLQPLDVGVFSPLKRHRMVAVARELREARERHVAEQFGADTTSHEFHKAMKKARNFSLQDTIPIYTRGWDKIEASVVQSAWRGAGLWPLDFDRLSQSRWVLKAELLKTDKELYVSPLLYAQVKDMLRDVFRVKFVGPDKLIAEEDDMGAFPKPASESELTVAVGTAVWLKSHQRAVQANPSHTLEQHSQAASVYLADAMSQPRDSDTDRRPVDGRLTDPKRFRGSTPLSNGVWASQAEDAGTPDTVDATPNKFNVAVQHIFAGEDGLADAAGRFLTQLCDGITNEPVTQAKIRNAKKKLSDFVQNQELLRAMVTYDGIDDDVAERLAMIGMIAARRNEVRKIIRECVTAQDEERRASVSLPDSRQPHNDASLAPEGTFGGVRRHLSFEQNATSAQPAVPPATEHLFSTEMSRSHQIGERIELINRKPPLVARLPAALTERPAAGQQELTRQNPMTIRERDDLVIRIRAIVAPSSSSEPETAVRVRHREECAERPLVAKSLRRNKRSREDAEDAQLAATGARREEFGRGEHTMSEPEARRVRRDNDIEYSPTG